LLFSPARRRRRPLEQPLNRDGVLKLMLPRRTNVSLSVARASSTSSYLNPAGSRLGIQKRIKPYLLCTNLGPVMTAAKVVDKEGKPKYALHAF